MLRGELFCNTHMSNLLIYWKKLKSIQKKVILSTLNICIKISFINLISNLNEMFY